MNTHLYQSKILDLAKAHNQRELISKPDLCWQNSLCGDEVRIQLSHKNQQLHVTARAYGCLLCKAATEKMMQTISSNQRQILSHCEQALLMFEKMPPEYDLFIVVKPHPARHSCVLLPITALNHLLNERLK